MKSSYPISSGWQLARVAPGTYAHPDDLSGAPLEWQEAQVPGTVAVALDALLDVAADYDAHDWWYRTTFAAPAACTPGVRPLRIHRGSTCASTAWPPWPRCG